MAALLSTYGIREMRTTKTNLRAPRSLLCIILRRACCMRSHVQTPFKSFSLGRLEYPRMFDLTVLPEFLSQLRTRVWPCSCYVRQMLIKTCNTTPECLCGRYAQGEQLKRVRAF